MGLVDKELLKLLPYCYGDEKKDELWGIFIKEMSMVEALSNLHPMETMLSKNSLEVSTTVSITNQSLVHWNSFLSSAFEVPESLEFNL